MEAHRRWYCRECKRERLRPEGGIAGGTITMTGNPDNGKNCIYCGSPEIELIEYKPMLPGLDIPREQLGNLKRIHTETDVAIPGLVSTKEYTMVTEKKGPLGRPAEDLITTPLTLPEIREERNSIYDLSDMD